MDSRPLGRAGEGLPQSAIFYRRQPDFLNGQRPLFYRGGCWRHAVHDGSDGPNDKEENLFSDRHWRQRRQGEAASSDHGFLYSFNPPYGGQQIIDETRNQPSTRSRIKCKNQNYQLNNPLFIFIGYWVHPCASFANLFPQPEPSEAPRLPPSFPRQSLLYI